MKDTSEQETKLPDFIIPKVYPQLLQLRKSTTVQLQPNALVKDHVKFRYYQVIGTMHLLLMNRMILGDGTGLGKCVTGNTLISTDKGLMHINSFCPENPQEDTFYPAIGFVINKGEKHPIKSFYYSGVKKTKKIETNCGYSIEGSLIHPILVREIDGTQKFKKLLDLKIGDRVCISRDTSNFPTFNPNIVPPEKGHVNCKKVRIPDILTPELSRLLGYLVAEGTVTNTHVTVFTQWNKEIRKDYIRIHKILFKDTPSEDEFGTATHSILIRKFLASAGLTYTTARFKTTPWPIFQATKECIKEYIKALYEGEATSLEGHIEMTMASEQIIRDVQILLLRFGIRSQLEPRYNEVYDYTYWRINITGDDARKFHRKIGFISSKKIIIPQEDLCNTNLDIVPGCKSIIDRCWTLLKKVTIAKGSNANRMGSGVKQFGESFRNKMKWVRFGHRDPSYDFLKEISCNLAKFDIIDLELEQIIKDNYFYDPIATIQDGTSEVMDLEIDDSSHMFVGNGFQNHNTVEFIGTYSYLLEKNPNLKLLIIAPKSATSQWVDEFAKFTNGITCQRLENFGKSSRIKQYEEFWTDPNKHVMVMHYHFFREDFRLYEQYLNRDFVLVMDEITAVKSHTSKTHKVACLVAEKAKRCYGLTATLLKNNLLEGYGIYKVVLPSLFGNITRFKTHYCVEKKQDIGGRKIPVVVGYKNVDHFRKMIDPFFLGRNKYDVSTELPELITKEISCSMSDRQWDYYTQALGDTLTLPTAEGELVEKEMSPLTRLGYFQQIVNHPETLGLEGESEKERELYRLLAEDLEGEKVIIFSKYKKMVNIIQRELAVQNIDTLRITGDEDEDQRTLNKLIFQEDQEAIFRWLKANVGPEADDRTRNRVLRTCKTQLRYIRDKKYPNIILLTPAGTEALNLQAAGAFIFYDIPWSPGDYDQLLGRMIRIGSEHKTVLAIHLMCKGTIDDYVLQTVLRKSKVIRRVLGEQTKGALQFERDSDISDLLNKLRSDAELLRTKGKGAFVKEVKDE